MSTEGRSSEDVDEFFAMLEPPEPVTTRSSNVLNLRARAAALGGEVRVR